MSGLVGKGVRSYKKAIVSDSNFPALGFVNFIMAFQNASNQVGPFTVSLIGTLTVPSEMVAAGFEQPDPITIGNAQLGNFRNNVIVTSNLNGILIDRISYTLTNDSITFDDGLNANEIIVIKRGNEAVTGNRIVDARPLRASGTVDFSTIGSAPVIFEVGEGFRIAPSTTATGGIDNRQIGFVQVFADGVLQARNVGNEDESMLPASEQTGNYREVIVDGNGNLLTTQNGVTANAIEFNQFQPFSAEEGVIVISTNLIVDSPNNTGLNDQIDVIGARVTAVETDVTANTAASAANTGELATIPAANTGTAGQALIVNSTMSAFELGSAGQSSQSLTQIGGTNTAGDGANAASESPFHWIVPAGVSSAKLYLTSGGGTGGVGPNPSAMRGGGGGGGTIITTVQVVAGERYELLIADQNFGISDAGGSGRGGRNGGSTVFRSPSGSATALISGKNRAVVVIGGTGGGRNGTGSTVPGGGFSASTNTALTNQVSTAVNFDVEVNALGGQGKGDIGNTNSQAGGGSFYEVGGAERQASDGQARGSGGGGFLGFPGQEGPGGAGAGGRGGIIIEYVGPASTINTGLTP